MMTSNELYELSVTQRYLTELAEIKAEEQPELAKVLLKMADVAQQALNDEMGVPR